MVLTKDRAVPVTGAVRKLRLALRSRLGGESRKPGQGNGATQGSLLLDLRGRRKGERATVMRRT